MRPCWDSPADSCNENHLPHLFTASHSLDEMLRVSVSGTTVEAGKFIILTEGPRKSYLLDPHVWKYELMARKHPADAENPSETNASGVALLGRLSFWWPSWKSARNVCGNKTHAGGLRGLAGIMLLGGIPVIYFSGNAVGLGHHWSLDLSSTGWCMVQLSADIATPDRSVLNLRSSHNLSITHYMKWHRWHGIKILTKWQIALIWRYKV